jgi:hypothetical protein
MGLIASAMGGAGEGLMNAGKQLGDYAEKSNLQAEAAEIQRMRDVTLAGLKKGEITAEANAKVDVATRSPRTLPAGASEVQDGKVVVTAPEKPHPPELLKYYEANANKLNADADAIRNGEKYRQKAGEKPRLPNIKVEKNDQTGEVYNIDQNSGAIGTIVPSKPAEPGKSHWFSADEPGKSAQPANIVWRLPDGRVLQNGLADLYPDISARTPEGAGAPAVAPSGGRPPLASFMKTAAPASAPAPSAPAPAAPMQPKTIPDIPGGADVDTARARLSAARSKVQSYGLIQQKRDPDGFEAAKRELAEAQGAVNSAMDTYQRGVEPGAARFRTK